jgi:hypothetical protein
VRGQIRTIESEIDGLLDESDRIAFGVYDTDTVTVARERLAERRHRAGRPSIEELRSVYGIPDDVELSRADFQALSRLEGSGIDQSTIVSIYLGCDRNEVLAQNFLLSIV